MKPLRQRMVEDMIPFGKKPKRAKPNLRTNRSRAKPWNGGCWSTGFVRPIDEGDFDKLASLVAVAVRESVANNEEDAKFLIKDIVLSLKAWRTSNSESFHAKYSVDDVTVGFVIVKEFWNVSHLFVLPRHQGRGIGRHLVQAAIRACRDKSPRGKIQLNSSINAAGFYAAMGFTQTGPGIERPGGCIPYEYGF